MSSLWEKQTIGRLMRDSIIQVCKTNQVYGGNIQIDAIICITGKCEGQEMVVKVHERVRPEGRLALTDFLSRPRDGWTSILSSSHEEDAEDYSLKRPRLDDSALVGHEADSYPNLKQHLMTPSHARDLREMQDLRHRESTSAKDLSMSSSALDMTPPSPHRSEQPYSQADSPAVSPENHGRPPHSPSYSSRYPYTSTPHSIFPRRIPLRPDRWSPSQAPPTIPECKPCGFTFNTFDVLSDHNEAVHSVFTCQSCFKTFTSRSNLERHSRLHTGHRPYGCTICGKTFSRKDHLTNHATKHAFKCGTCSKRFTDKKMLVTHYSFDHNTILTNICDYCNKGFSSSEMYEEHLKAHPQCSGNGTVKMEDEEMPQNLSTSSGNSPVKYLCKKCMFSTADKLTLLKHQIIHQENTRCYTCLSCAKIFEDPLHYSDHLLMHSSETNIFECCLCRHICPTLTSLRRHEATHLNTDFQNEPSYGTTPSKTYSCVKCQKSFASEYNLIEHMEIHAKSDGFVCSICSEEFDNYGEICSHIEQKGHYAYSQPVQNGSASSPKNKRKQKIPKAVKHLDIDQESDVEIVEPESPDDLPNGEDLSNGEAADFLNHSNSGQFVVTENPASVIEVSPEEQDVQPVKRLLTQTLITRSKEKQEVMDVGERMNAIESALARHRGSPSPQKSARSFDKTSSSSKPGETNNNVMLSPKLMNVEIPPGPYICSICSNEIPTFQELEMHCFSDHNRSPCMFCSKTFAQKANRDRHVCLHTGEKPYSCPDCSEKFSRGDKLKIHRMRAHQTSFPPVPSRSRGDNSAQDNSGSPTVSPAESQDSSAAGLITTSVENTYSAGEWSVKGDSQSQFVMAGGEWSVKEEKKSADKSDDTAETDNKEAE